MLFNNYVILITSPQTETIAISPRRLSYISHDAGHQQVEYFKRFITVSCSLYCPLCQYIDMTLQSSPVIVDKQAREKCFNLCSWLHQMTNSWRSIWVPALVARKNSCLITTWKILTHSLTTLVDERRRGLCRSLAVNSRREPEESDFSTDAITLHDKHSPVDTEHCSTHKETE